MEADSMRVQKVAAERRHALDRRRRAIKRIASHWMAEAGEVDADLMRAAGADPHFEQSEAREAVAARDIRDQAARPSSSRAVMRVRCTGSRAMGRSMRPCSCLTAP